MKDMLSHGPCPKASVAPALAAPATVQVTLFSHPFVPFSAFATG